MNTIPIVLTAALAFASSASATSTMEELSQRAISAAEVVTTSARTTDREIPQSLLKQATCVATFPKVIRIGFVVGVRFGQGMVSCRVDGGWSNPAYMNIAGGSWGAQIGLDSTDLILVFVNQNAIDRVSKDKLELGAGAAVSAGPFGRDAAIGTDFRLDSEIFAYSRSKGLYAGIAINGSVLDVDSESNQMVYGANVDAMTILKSAFKSEPTMVQPYVQALTLLAN